MNFSCTRHPILALLSFALILTYSTIAQSQANLNIYIITFGVKGKPETQMSKPILAESKSAAQEILAVWIKEVATIDSRYNTQQLSFVAIPVSTVSNEVAQKRFSEPRNIYRLTIGVLGQPNSLLNMQILATSWSEAQKVAKSWLSDQAEVDQTYRSKRAFAAATYARPYIMKNGGFEPPARKTINQEAIEGNIFANELSGSLSSQLANGLPQIWRYISGLPKFGPWLVRDLNQIFITSLSRSNHSLFEQKFDVTVELMNESKPMVTTFEVPVSMVTNQLSGATFPLTRTIGLNDSTIPVTKEHFATMSRLFQIPIYVKDTLDPSVLLSLTSVKDFQVTIETDGSISVRAVFLFAHPQNGFPDIREGLVRLMNTEDASSLMNSANAPIKLKHLIATAVAELGGVVGAAEIRQLMDRPFVSTLEARPPTTDAVSCLKILSGR